MKEKSGKGIESLYHHMMSYVSSISKYSGNLNGPMMEHIDKTMSNLHVQVLQFVKGDFLPPSTMEDEEKENEKTTSTDDDDSNIFNTYVEKENIPLEPGEAFFSINNETTNTFQNNVSLVSALPACDNRKKERGLHSAGEPLPSTKPTPCWKLSTDDVVLTEENIAFI